MRRLVLVLGCLVVITPVASAQSFPYTVADIMRGAAFVGTPPSNVRFSPDGRYVYFRWRAPGVDTLDQDYRAAVRGGTPERLARHVMDTTATADGAWSPDGTRELVELNGDIYLVTRDGTKRRLTDTPDNELSPSWSADGRTVYFRRGDNAWALALDGGREAQVTNIHRGTPPAKPDSATGERKFLEDQQKELFDVVRRRLAAQRLAADTDTTGRMPLWVAEGDRIADLAVSPDGQFALVTVSQRAKDARQTIMPVWVTATGFVETQNGRTKVGDAQDRFKTAVVSLTTGKATWIDSTVGTGPRDITGVSFSPNGHHALVRAAATDYKDVWLAVVDLPSLAVRVVAHDHDDAWVNLFLRLGEGWLKDGETVWYGSESSGYMHLYTVSAAGGAARARTSGAWEVQRVVLPPDGKTFYLETNQGDWGQVHAYALPVAGGAPVALTTGEGRQSAEVSPDGTTLALLASTSNHPPELYLQANKPGAPARQVTESPSADWKRFAWIKPEIVMIPASDGAQVPARIYRPFGGPANRAAVIFVHGAGYLQNMHKLWSDYSHEYMFNQLLASKGYTVLDLDYRASAGHGRDWRTAIYRHMGGRDLDDQVDAARWLVHTQGVDSARIGIYGGSYGGFITLMAMFTRPGVFAAGAALRPVTDWAHYNNPYTASILNFPQTDSVAYRQSSPIYFAAGLQGRLLICHGMVDNNVHFEDTARLIQRLIELGKEHWEAAVYPVESHGFVRADSWTDEYRRIFALFEESIGGRKG